jgi:hypothetical protein
MVLTNTLEARRADADRRKQSLTMQLTPEAVSVDADADNDGFFVSGVALADEGIVTTRVRGEYSAPRGDFRVVGAPPSLFPPVFGGRHRALKS